MIAALLATSALAATPGPTNAPAATPSPAAIASPAPALQTPPVLGGITLGENSDGVLARFGLHPRGWPTATVVTGATTRGELRVFPSRKGDVVVGIFFDAKIHVVMVTGLGDATGQFLDPKGVRLGDEVDRLTQLRGAPDGKNASGDLLYGRENAVHWFFTVHDGKITTIGLSDGS